MKNAYTINYLDHLDIEGNNSIKVVMDERFIVVYLSHYDSFGQTTGNWRVYFVSVETLDIERSMSVIKCDKLLYEHGWLIAVHKNGLLR